MILLSSSSSTARNEWQPMEFIDDISQASLSIYRICPFYLLPDFPQLWSCTTYWFWCCVQVEYFSLGNSLLPSGTLGFAFVHCAFCFISWVNPNRWFCSSGTIFSPSFPLRIFGGKNNWAKAMKEGKERKKCARKWLRIHDLLLQWEKIRELDKYKYTMKL